MTKLPPANGTVKNYEKVIEENEETKRLDLNSDIMKSSSPGRIQTAVAHNVIDLDNGQRNTNHHINNNSAGDSYYGEVDSVYEGDDDDDYIDNFSEPLGYQSFLCDVNIEYSPGGKLSTSLSNKHCFKMKCLPYMVESNRNELLGMRSLSIDDEDSTTDMIDCDRGDERYLNKSDKDDDRRSDTFDISPHRNAPIDVTRETCAFLGNSDYVPKSKYKTRQVILELVSAKLSQSNGYIIPPNSSFTNLITLAEDGPSSAQATTSATSTNSDTSSLRSFSSHSSRRVSHPDLRSQVHISTPRKVPSSSPSPPLPTSPSSSKKFVNYTILIKTIPGLDKCPAVVERRFSDFLNLYQGLKSNEVLADIVDRNVTFPKKVYMGNFSLEKIAERSIEFSRLLHLCMTEFNLLWSVPFISFLIDKELKEAHRLALFGDPDDVQALIETAYFIEQKLYMRLEPSTTTSSSSTNSLDLLSDHHSQPNSPSLPNMRPTPSPNTTTPNQMISIDANGSTSDHDNAQPRQDSIDSGDNGLGRNQSISETSYCSSRVVVDKSILAPINQRILVTFCMLFITYCRTNNYSELRKVVRNFGRLIASQEYIDSLVNTRHYNSLRACLLFLMNMTQGNVINDSLRLQLKRRLEDIDGAKADLANSLNGNGTEHNKISSRSYSSSSRGDNGLGDNRGATRITKNDLTSLLRDRNFCLFQS